VHEEEKTSILEDEQMGTEMQQTSPISEHVPSESSQDLLQKISSYKQNEKKIRRRISKSIQAMKCRLWNKKSTKAKKGGKGKIPKYLNIEKDTTKIPEVHHISDNEKAVHNITRIQEHNNSNREMQTSSQRSTNLVEDLSDSGIHLTLSATNNFKDINGKLIVNLRPLRIGNIQRLEQNHINDTDMDSIVEESHEEF